MTGRSARGVLDDHLRKRDAGELEADLAANYADDVVLICRLGVFRGRDGVRESAQQLFAALGPSRFRYDRSYVEGEYGFLEWSALSATRRIDDGADSYVIREGRIAMQTVHYTVTPR